jgi:two-component system, chemotaxis family, protein-glutamate methylesterase/glutaminase
VVLHVAPSGTSVLPSILARSSLLPVRAAGEGERIVAGRVYVAPPAHHLVVERSCLRLTKTPRENGHRPAIDPTMRSAARAFGGSTIGVILSGSRDDGTIGLLAIKQAGGLVVVQEPGDALYPSMPLSAIEHVEVDAVVPLDRMAAWLLSRHAADTTDRRGGRMAGSQLEGDGPHPPGAGSRFTCPDSGGVLFERKDSELERFACSVGHVYGIDSLVQAQGAALEHALWTAVRSLEDRAVLLQRMAERASRAGSPRTTSAFAGQARDAQERAVKVWNGHSTELWGVRADEAEDEPLLSLDIGLPLDELRRVMQSVLTGGEPRADALLDATNRRGRPVRLRVTCLPLAVDGAQRVDGAIVLMDVVGRPADAR